MNASDTELLRQALNLADEALGLLMSLEGIKPTIITNLIHAAIVIGEELIDQKSPK